MFPIKKLLFAALSLLSCSVFSQTTIPSVFTNIHSDEKGNLYLERDGRKIYASPSKAKYTIKNLQGSPKGTETGIAFDFGLSDFEGSLYFGLIPFQDSKYPQPIFYKKEIKIKDGKAEVEIKNALGTTHDIVKWETKGNGTLGYRVADKRGKLLYDGIVSFKYNGTFTTQPSLVEGPFVNILTSQGVTISFDLDSEIDAYVEVNGTKFSSEKAIHHEILIAGLQANTTYTYKVVFGENSQSYSFKTAPKAGSRTPFTFAYASDSRAGAGGGEIDFLGTNYYIMKRIMALASANNIAFMQFTGDLVSGYTLNKEDMNLQYANWKRVVGTFAKYYPVYVGVGNHEVLINKFVDTVAKIEHWTPKFPFNTESMEAVFAKNFVNPTNGPESEDGAVYDPDKSKIDFPSYRENVFYYTYDNVAMIVLNTEYWYSPNYKSLLLTGGNVHGYIMDNQLQWLKATIEKLEKDETIDHIFVTNHTPVFPNGGHVADAMYYNGNNAFRPMVAGKSVEKGIMEVRNELLDILANQSKKCRAIFVGDEHNYCRTRIDKNVPIYPEKYDGKRIEISRTIYQITNGACGAPYYSQEQTPWTSAVSGFTSHNALVFINVSGKKVSLKVINPDTLEVIDETVLTE